MGQARQQSLENCLEPRPRQHRRGCGAVLKLLGTIVPPSMLSVQGSSEPSGCRLVMPETAYLADPASQPVFFFFFFFFFWVTG